MDSRSVQTSRLLRPYAALQCWLQQFLFSFLVVADNLVQPCGARERCVRVGRCCVSAFFAPFTTCQCFFNRVRPASSSYVYPPSNFCSRLEIQASVRLNAVKFSGQRFRIYRRRLHCWTGVSSISIPLSSHFGFRFCCFGHFAIAHGIPQCSATFRISKTQHPSCRLEPATLEPESSPPSVSCGSSNQALPSSMISNLSTALSLPLVSVCSTLAYMRMLLLSVRFRANQIKASGKIRQAKSPFDWLVHSQGCGRLDCKGKTVKLADELAACTLRGFH